MKRQISILPRNNPMGRNWFHQLQLPTYCLPVAWAWETRLMPEEIRNALLRLSAAVAVRTYCLAYSALNGFAECGQNYATPKLCGTYDCVTPLIWLQVFLDRIYILRQL
ncbi:MAG: hypothetical protein PUP92_19395 [Rhizonema sp. PD38]|nr:hypothetical protein [Rhizonema sp. PD38]